MPTRGGTTNSVLPSRSPRGLARSAVRVESGGEQQQLGKKEPANSVLPSRSLRGLVRSAARGERGGEQQGWATRNPRKKPIHIYAYFI